MMKVYVLKDKDDITEIPPDLENIYTPFRPNTKDILTLIKKAPSLKRLLTAPTYAKTLSTSTQILLDMQDVEVMVSNRFWGHRTDKNQYAVIEETQE